MTDLKPTIHIIATSGIFSTVEKYSETLTNEYEIKTHRYERFSAADGSTILEFMNLVVNLKSTIGNFLQSYIQQESLEYIFKYGVLKQFYKWLKVLETGIVDNLPREIEYVFDDVTIKIGYSKNNHINAVGLICTKVNSMKEALEKESIKRLTMVASPVKKNNGEWHFYIPDDTFQINNYLDFLGLVINDSNRCVLDKTAGTIIFEHWW